VTVSNYPYWMTIQGDGTHVAGAASEQIQVYPGQIIQLTVTAAYELNYTYASGAAALTLSFFTATGTPISSFLGAAPTTMAGGTQYQFSTTASEVPSNASYAVAYLQQGGVTSTVPASNNLLQIFQAEVDQGGVAINQNYAFTYTYFPWSNYGTGAQVGWTFSPLIANDFDSLVIDNIIETLGGPGGVQCTLPGLLDSNGAGPRFRILAPPSLNSAAYGYEASYDLNAPQPTQDVVASMLLDGERPFGTRASNRTMSYPIIIFGTQAGGMKQVYAAMELLMQTIDQGFFPIKWTPADTGLPMIFDSFRALPSNPVYGFNYNAGGSATGSPVGRPNCPIGMITLSIQAMPYGRSDVDGVQNLTFTNPLVSGNPGSSAVTVDNFTSINGPSVIGSKTASGSALTSVIPITASTATQAGTLVTMTCPNATAQTVTATDTKGNTYSVVGSEQLASAPAVSIFTLASQQNSTPLVAGTDTITVTTTNSQPMTCRAYTIPSLQALDTQTVNSGTTAAPSVTSRPATQSTNPVTLAFFANNNSQVAQQVAGTAGWTYGNNLANGTLSTDMFWQSDAGTTAVTCTTAYGSSSPVVAVCLTLDVTVGTNWIPDTQNIILAGGSAHYFPPRPMHMPWPAAVYPKTLPAPVNITGLPNLSVWFGQAYDVQWPRDTKFRSNVTLAYVLTDNNGKTLSFSASYKNVTWGETPTTPKWTQITASIPQGNTSFSYDAVSSYQVTVSNWSGSGHVGYVRMHAWLNGLTANPQTIANATSPRGIVYNVFGMAGTARSEISVQAQLPAEANQVVEYTGPSSGYWVVPPYVYTVQGETWGGGGAGATCNLARVIGGAGGGGAAYSCEPALSVVPGQKVPYSVGAGGLPAQVSPTVLQFVTPGLSHWTCPIDVTTAKIELWGGGAAGAAGGGGGGGAEYAAEPNFSSGTYANGLTTTLTPGVTYYIWVAHGGTADTGTSAAARGSRLGETSWFGPTSCPGPNHAYIVSYGGVSPLTGGTNGGTGGINSTATTRWTGGQGGSSPGPAGGGGGAAANPTGRGLPGGDSPASSVYGRWQGSGAGGVGATSVSNPQTQGGSGGAGASVPGFPVAGTQPGGGGGGGYSGPPLSSSIQPATEKLSQATVNFLGANGGAGLVQISYEIGGGSPVPGGATSFGSLATTAKVVTANGGNSALSNSAVGALGGVAGANTISFGGGQGGFSVTGPQGAYIGAPRVNNIFQALNNLAYTTASGTTTAAASSCAQGVGVVLVESAAPVSDLYVSDSAGNVYTQQSSQSGGTAGTGGVTIYAFTSNLQFAITTATTLTVASATAQQYGVLWYASPWLVGGITAANASSSHGNGTAISGTFAEGDGSSLQYELVLVVNDGTQAFTQTAYNNRLWYPASTTGSQTAGALIMNAYVGLNEGGANGVNTADNLTASIGSAANWATLCIPLLAANQAQSVVQMDWRTGTTPGASTTWTNAASIDAQGVIAVVGMCGSGASITAAPSAVHDASGNVYTKQAYVQLPSNGGNIWAYTAPVTAGLAQGVTGSINWGTVSAAPEYWASVYWLPNVSASAPVTAGATGTSTTPAVTWASVTAQPDTVLLSVLANAVSASFTGGPPVSGGTNQVDQTSTMSPTPGYLNARVYATQIVDAASGVFSGTYSGSNPWGSLGLGFAPNSSYTPDSALGQGGGAAAGPNGPGYPATFNFGGPGFAGGGKGGAGAQSLNSGGGGAAIPGGGGGGAWGNSVAVPQSGGQGAAGLVRLTWQPPLQPFNTLIIHKPSNTANNNISPITPIPITDIPNNTEYTVPALVPGVNAVFDSTYTVLLANYYWDSPQSSRQVSVTINQYEYPGGPRYSVQATKALTPATDVVNGVVNLGEVTLPIKDYSNHNDQSYFTVAVNDTDTNDRFMDVLMLDTQGSTVLINVAPGTPGYGTYVNYYVDETTPNKDLGFIGATVQDREHQVSILDFASVNGGPLYLSPGDNTIMTWSPSGAPYLGITYAPRWYLTRTV
jgi:hypothetical protein